jgi:hypothetical protein
MQGTNSGDHKRKSIFGAVVAFVGFALMLSGCIRMDIALNLLVDDQVSLAVDMAFNDAAVREAGMEPADLWNQAIGEFGTEFPEGVQLNEYSEGGWTGGRIMMAATPFSSMADMAGAGSIAETLNLQRVGDEYVLTATGIGMLEAVEESDPTGQITVEDLEMTFTVSCPGPIVESNGTATGNRVVWDLTTINQADEISMRCSALPAPDMNRPVNEGSGTVAPVPVDASGSQNWLARWWPALLIGLVVLAGLIGLIYFLRRASHRDRLAPTNFEHTNTWTGPVEAQTVTVDDPVAVNDVDPFLTTSESSTVYEAPIDDPIGRYEDVDPFSPGNQ